MVSWTNRSTRGKFESRRTEKHAGNVLRCVTHITVMTCNACKCYVICQILEQRGIHGCNRVNRVGMFLNRVIFSHAQSCSDRDQNRGSWCETNGQILRESSAQFPHRAFSSEVYLTMHASLAEKNALIALADRERSRWMQSGCTWSLEDRSTSVSVIRHLINIATFLEFRGITLLKFTLFCHFNLVKIPTLLKSLNFFILMLKQLQFLCISTMVYKKCNIKRIWNKYLQIISEIIFINIYFKTKFEQIYIYFKDKEVKRTAHSVY